MITITKQNEKFLPPQGCITEIAKALHCHRNTVGAALRKNTKGEKAEKVRAFYKAKYLKIKN